MPTIRTDDGVGLYYEEAGTGTPIVFVHEFGGDIRSWEPQMRHFSRRYRCIAFSARGYLPSDVPESLDRYSQERVRDDIRCVLDGLGIDRAHVVGCSMGAFATLHFGMEYCSLPKKARALSLTLAGCGSGAHPAVHRKFQADSVAFAGAIRRDGIARFVATWGHGPTRLQFLAKDPRGFAEYAAQFAEHSQIGSANTMEGYLGRRQSLYELTERLAAIAVPVLVVTGDEDEPCLEASLLVKRTVPGAGLVVLPKTGHAANLEEPEAFNRALDEYLHQVTQGRWGPRDPRTQPESPWGPAGKPAPG